MEVVIIIVNYNAGNYLVSCVHSVLNQHYPYKRIIIVDNASSDGSLLQLPVDERLTILQNEENRGFAAAVNQAVVTIPDDEIHWIALINPDVQLAPNWLQQMIHTAEQKKDYHSFGSTQIHWQGNPSTLIQWPLIDHQQAWSLTEIKQYFAQYQLDGTGDCYHALGFPYRRHYGSSIKLLPQSGPIFSPCAAAALYSLRLFKQVGGMEERFFCYCEDVDLGFRMRLEAGAQAWHVAEAIAFHAGSAISNQYSGFAIYHGFRNRIWLWIRMMPPYGWCLFLLPHLALELLFVIRAIKRGYQKEIFKATKDALNINSLKWLLHWRQKEKQNISTYEWWKQIRNWRWNLLFWRRQ
jgi:N-acetylglucosaminyl-diphospho-decaprenol L-rhamnosyltransferase